MISARKRDHCECRAWRGRIQHVSSGGEQQFERIQEMLAFISNQLVHDRSQLFGFEQRLNAD